MRLVDWKESSGSVPWYFGRVYYEPTTDRLRVCLVPFNLCWSVGLAIWWRLQRGWLLKEPVGEAYRNGYEEGEAYGAILGQIEADKEWEEHLKRYGYPLNLPAGERRRAQLRKLAERPNAQ